MSRGKRIVGAVLAAGLAVVLGFAAPAAAQPSANQVLSDLGWPPDAKQRVLGGEYVTQDGKTVSDRDLAVEISFLVKTSPADLSREVIAGELSRSDAQVQATGELSGEGDISELAGLQITSATAQAFSSAQPGQALNLSTSEIAAFDALQGASTDAVQQQLRQMLLARYKTYRASGLSGIAPYDRGGSSTDVGAELRQATEASAGLARYVPAFQQALMDYPQGTTGSLQNAFHWVSYDINGAPTYVLTHTLTAPEGKAAVVVQRQFYVSTGYNAEQAVAGFLPVKEGTIVVYSNHTFTDQVAGFGGSLKRDIGRRMMTTKLKQMFDAARVEAAH
jgi:hypothetical protein